LESIDKKLVKSESVAPKLAMLYKKEVAILSSVSRAEAGQNVRAVVPLPTSWKL
jgi:hypothetical protein